MSDYMARDSDKQRGLLFLALFIATAVAALALPHLTDISLYEASALLAVPFIVLGVLDMAVARRWLPLVSCLVIPAVLYLVSWEFSFAALALLCGSTGVAASTELIHRFLILRLLGFAEHCNAGPERGLADMSVSFFFGIPKDYDARNMMINGTIRREKVPWDIMAKSFAPAFLLLVLLWMYISASTGIRSDIGEGALLIISASLYIAAVSAPWAILAVTDARIEVSGSTFRLFDGFFSTMKHMAVPLLLGLIIVVIASDPGWDAFKLAAASLVFCAVVELMAMMKFSNHAETEVVSDLYQAWTDTHPVDFYSGFDGRNGKHPLDDGVPGTPRRLADSCFPPQK